VFTFSDNVEVCNFCCNPLGRKTRISWKWLHFEPFRLSDRGRHPYIYVYMRCARDVLERRFTAKADISSGDSPNAKTLGTFKRHQWTRFQTIRYAL